MTRGEVRVNFNCLSKKALCDLVLGCSVFVEMPETPLIDFPGIEARRGFPQYPLLLGLGESGLDNGRYGLGNLILHREDVGQSSIVTVSPYMSVG